MANKPADDAADIKETTNAETIKNVNSTYAQGPINKCSLKRTHSPSTIEENKDYDNIPSKFLIAELNGNESLADISPNNILEQLVNANGSLEIAHSSPENYSDPIQFQIENRLEQIELKLETIDSKLDSFLISIQKILEQKQNESTTFGRTATHSERAAKVKVEIDADFVPPALPICINDDLLTLDEKCRSNACYMEQMVVLLISEANVILLDSKCEKKLVRGFMEILFSYDLLENYTLSGAAGFNGEKSKGCFRNLYGIYQLLNSTINFDTKIPYSEKQINDGIKTFFKYLRVNKKRLMDRKNKSTSRLSN